MFEKMNALSEIHTAAMTKLKADGEVALKEGLSEFFQQFPQVQAIRWRQYTPYFNDGDACVFSVHEPHVKLSDTPEDAGDYEDGFVSDWDLSENPANETLCDAFSALSRLIQSDSMEPVLQSVFGDHAEVTATRDSITVEEYSHD